MGQIFCHLAHKKMTPPAGLSCLRKKRGSNQNGPKGWGKSFSYHFFPDSQNYAGAIRNGPDLVRLFVIQAGRFTGLVMISSLAFMVFS
jgi:hypothetical protein